MTHFLYVKSFLLVHLINKSKKLEIRGLNNFTKNIQAGDSIRFNNKVERIVKAVHTYNDLTSAINSWNPELFCPEYTRELIQSALQEIYFGKVVVFELE